MEKGSPTDPFAKEFPQRKIISWNKFSKKKPKLPDFKVGQILKIKLHSKKEVRLKILKIGVNVFGGEYYEMEVLA